MRVHLNMLPTLCGNKWGVAAPLFMSLNPISLGAHNEVSIHVSL